MISFLQSLLIVIVKYNRDLEECESFNSIKKIEHGEKEKLAVFVYDNSPVAQKISAHKSLNIIYFQDPENPGVSKAYNAGVEYARQHQKKWVLLLDQDTSLPCDILENYCQAIKENPKLKLFAPILRLKNGKIFSPSRYRFKRGFFLNKILAGTHSLYELAPVNSGIMVEVETFLKVGGYNEAVQLDFSDFQFIERFRKIFQSFYVIDVECEQDFSDDEISYKSQYVRFKYFCSGALNIEEKSFWDWLQYNSVVFVRAFRLTLRYGKLGFIGTYLNDFLFSSKSAR